MKAEMINPFITATLNVLSTMAGIEAKKGEVYIKQDDRMSYDISGVIGIAGKMSGFVVVSFPEKLALDIVSGFLGEPKKNMSKDVVDAIGEFVNMIALSMQLFPGKSCQFLTFIDIIRLIPVILYCKLPRIPHF